MNSLKENKSELNHLKNETNKRAAILIIILTFNDFKNDPHILFTKRSSSLRTHSGEVSFPGGKEEDDDLNLFSTGLREANEEINLKIEHVKKKGELKYLFSKHGIKVYPYVVTLDNYQEFLPNSEISDIFTVPISFLIKKKNIYMQDLSRNNTQIKIPSWVYNGFKIWGLTAMITAEFLNIYYNANIIVDFEKSKR